MIVGPMRMSIVQIDADEVERAETNSALSADCVSKRAYPGNRPLEDYCFKAIAMIEMDVHRADDEVMMIVTNRGQSNSEIADVVLVNV